MKTVKLQVLWNQAIRNWGKCLNNFRTALVFCAIATVNKEFSWNPCHGSFIYIIIRSWIYYISIVHLYGKRNSGFLFEGRYLKLNRYFLCFYFRWNSPVFLFLSELSYSNKWFKPNYYLRQNSNKQWQCVQHIYRNIHCARNRRLCFYLDSL
jgi:hypothetical protein